MKISIHYRMNYSSTPMMNDELREQGVMAWHLFRVVTDDDSGLDISFEPIAIFNLDSEAMTFQRFIMGGGVVEADRELVAQYKELADIRARRDARVEATRTERPKFKVGDVVRLNVPRFPWQEAATTTVEGIATTVVDGRVEVLTSADGTMWDCTVCPSSVQLIERVDHRVASCSSCRGTGTIETGNNDHPCDCPLGDTALFNTNHGTETGAQIKARRR